MFCSARPPCSPQQKPLLTSLLFNYPYDIAIVEDKLHWAGLQNPRDSGSATPRKSSQSQKLIDIGGKIIFGDRLEIANINPVTPKLWY